MTQPSSNYTVSDWATFLPLLLQAKPRPSLNAIPYKLLLHLIVLLSLSVVILCYAFQWGNYTIAMQQMTCAYFYPNSCSVDECAKFLTTNEENCYLYTMNDTALAINKAIAAYGSITDVSLAQFKYTTDACTDVDIKNAKLSIHYRTDDTYSVRIDNDYDMSTTYQLLQLPHIRHVDLHFPLINTRQSDIYDTSYAWTMHMKYSLLNEVKYRVSSAVSLQGECSSRSVIVDNATNYSLGVAISTFLLILVLATPLHIIFLLQELVVVYRSLVFVKHQLQSLESQTEATSTPLLDRSRHLHAPSDLYGNDDERTAILSWDTFPLQAKILLCDLWSLPTLLGSLLSFVFACLSVRGGVLPSKGEEAVLGIAAMLYWFGLLAYLRHNSRIFAALIILGGALTKIGKVISGALPLAVGFMLLGMVVFAESANFFSNFQQTVYTLFSVMNGDSIWDAMNQADQVVGGFGSLFVVLFYAFFNYILLRILLACIEGMYWYFTVYAELRRKRGFFRSMRKGEAKLPKTRIASVSTDSSVGIHPGVLPVSMFTEIIRGNDGEILDEEDIIFDMIALGDQFRRGELRSGSYHNDEHM